MTAAADGPFVGRTDLLAELAGALDAGSSLLVRGPAGVGKTRLVAEALDAAAVPEELVERVVASPSTRPFRLGALSALGAPDDVGPGDVPALVGWFLARWRTSRRGDRAPLVWVDDAQQLDGLSAAVLRQALAAGIVQLVVTHRTPEPLPEEVVALETDRRVAVHDVPALDRDATAALAEHLAGRPLDTEDLAELFELTGGHPLYVRNLVDARAGRGGSSLRSLDALVGARFRRLDPAVRRVAELVATAGELDVRLVADEFDHVSTLRRHGLVRGRGDDRLRLAHPLYAAWLVDALGPLTGRAHAELIERASALPGVVDDVALADWHLRAGLDLPAELAAAATGRALARADGPNALRFVTAYDGVERTLWEGQARVLSGDLDAGLALLERARAQGPPRVRVAAASWSARFLGLMRGEVAAAHEALDAVADVADDPELERDVLTARLWLWIFSPGKDATTLEQVTTMLEGARPDRLDDVELAAAAGSVLHEVGGPTRAEPALRLLDGLDHEDPSLPVTTRARVVAVQGWSAVYRGDARRGARLHREMLADALEQGSSEGAALLAGAGALTTAMAGEVRASLAMSASIEHLRTGPDWFRYRELERLVHAGNRVLAGEPLTPDVAREVADRAEGDGTELETALAVRALVLRREAMGHARPTDQLVTAFRRLAASPQRCMLAVLAGEVLSGHDGAALHRLVLDAMERTDQRGVTAPTADAARARLDGDHELLLHAGASHERIGLPVAASRAFADVARDPTAGEQRQVIARRGVVRSLRRWDGAPTWWTDDVAGLPTARQVDVAWRVVQGRTVAEISNELVLSRRTVENHVYRVGRALGVSGREELGAALAPPGRDVGWEPRRRDTTPTPSVATE